MKLRYFQEEGVSICRDQIVDLQRLILCAPTGSGKTITSCHIVSSSIKKGTKICVLVHRIELLRQFVKAFSLFNISPSLITSESKSIKQGDVYLGMVETFSRRKDKYDILKEMDFFIMDEAHSTVYYKIIEAFPDAFFLGLTATPQASGARPLNQYYNGIVELAKVERLIKEGYLADSRTFSIDSLSEGKKLKKKGKDFSEESQLEFFHTPKLYQGDLENYVKYAEGKKFISYCVNVAHSKETARKFTEAGFLTKHIDGEMDKNERNLILSQLRRGEIKGVTNFGIVTAGFDEDTVDCIIQNFATTELSKHIQTAGRGARIREGKNDFIILDMGSNYARHGLWNSDRDWIDIFNNPSNSSERERQRQEKKENLMCDDCGFILSVKDENCPNCNKEVKKILVDKSKDAKGVDLKEIRQELKSRLPNSLKKPFHSMSYAELKEYASLMGYGDKWVGIQSGLKRKRFHARKK